jgi:outer membrane protein TolC
MPNHFARALFFLSIFASSSSSWGFSEDDFETIVRSENAEIKALYERKEVLKSSLEEAELIFGWQFIGGINRRMDRRPSNDPNFSYDSLETFGAQVGVQRQFNFGLESKLSLNSTQTRINSGNAGGGTFDSKNWETQPTLDLKLPLLSGGMGSKVNAEYQLQLARKRLEALEAEVAYDAKMNEAKTLLWSTILQREHLAFQIETVKRIGRIYELVRRKAERNLEASSNLLQTRSALESAELELKTIELLYKQLERLLKLVLNRVSGIEIPSYNFSKFKKFDPSSTLGNVTAQERILSLSEDSQYQSSILAKEATRPRLDLVASMSLSGRDEKWADSVSEVPRGRYPTNFIGVEWVMALDSGINQRARERQDVLLRTSIAKKSYYQNQQRDAVFQDVVAQYNQMVDMLLLTLNLEKTQNQKLKNERRLIDQGRSSIYQVLQFELDLARAQAGKFSLALEMEKSKQQLAQYRYSSYE